MSAADDDRRDPFARPGDVVSPKICFCMKVHEATLRRAIADGVVDLEELRRATRAGTGCGTCRPDLEQLLAEDELRRRGQARPERSS